MTDNEVEMRRAVLGVSGGIVQQVERGVRPMSESMRALTVALYARWTDAKLPPLARARAERKEKRKRALDRQRESRP